MITIGQFEIISVQTGTFRLDGGAMFGVVPKTMWASHEDVDDKNRILLAARTLMAVSGDRKFVILVDTGTGPKWPAKEAARFDIHYDHDAIPRALESQFGLSVDSVTDVIITHFHFDHNGGLTEWKDQPDGELKLRFPQANHWIHRRHWEHVQAPSDKDRASFLARDFAPLESSGMLRIVDGPNPESPWESIAFFVSDGHTPGQLLPVFSAGDRELLFTGDVFPTASHLRVPWVMAYDLEPLKTIEEKKQILERSRKRSTWLAFPHDHRLGGAIIDYAENKPFVSRPLDL